MANPNTPPQTLFRGTTLPASTVNESIFDAPLLPGSEPQIDEHGRRTDRSGNEHGVYMTDNPHMAEVSYATPRHGGDELPDSPIFNTPHRSQARVEMPRVGVVHRVDATKVAGVRKPFLSGTMQGVHNNGYKGNEWIADEVPAGSHEVTRLRVGPDLLHPERVFDVGQDDNPKEVLQAVLDEVAVRAGRLATASALIGSLPEEQRFSLWAVRDVLGKIPPIANSQDKNRS